MPEQILQQPRGIPGKKKSAVEEESPGDESLSNSALRLTATPAKLSALSSSTLLAVFCEPSEPLPLNKLTELQLQYRGLEIKPKRIDVTTLI